MHLLLGQVARESPTRALKSRASELGTGEVRAVEQGVAQVGIGEIGAIEPGIGEVGACEFAPESVAKRSEALRNLAEARLTGPPFITPSAARPRSGRV